MNVTAHHVAFRVADLDRSTHFYEQAFGGKTVIDLELDHEFTESIFAAEPGTTAKNRVIVFDKGAIEIFELSPTKPIPAADQTSVGIMHLCLMVDDVAATVSRVESAGGKSRFPVRRWQSHHFVYVEDPDGHVIELLDATMEECIELTTRSLPDVAPDAVSSIVRAPSNATDRRLFPIVIELGQARALDQAQRSGRPLMDR